MTHRSSAVVGLAKSVLDAAGIVCFIIREAPHAQLDGNPLGAVRLFEPALCVHNAADQASAVALLRAVMTPESTALPAEDWQCTCGETVPGNFAECWACGSPAGELPERGSSTSS